MLSHIRRYFKLRQMKNNSAKLKKLTLSMYEPEPIQFVEELATNTSIETLHIKYLHTNFTQSLWSTLLKVIGKNQTIQILDFSTMGLDDEHIQNLALFLKNNQNLRELNLNKNNITAVGATTVADILTGTNRLKKLTLSSEKSIGKGFNDVFQVLQKNTQLVSLIIEEKWKANGIDDRHIDALVEMVTLNTTLKELNLCGNEFSDQGTQKLCQGLAMNNTLESVNLDSTTIGEQGWSAIDEWVSKTISLKSLSIGNERVGKWGSNTTDNEIKETITEVGLTNFLEAFKLNTSVKHLRITFKKDSDFLAIKIAEILKTNNTLASIVLKNCPYTIKQKGVETLISALKTNTSVYKIEEGGLMKIKPSPGAVKPETANELQRLLTRNKLIKAIKEAPAALPQLLKNVSYALLDDVFFMAVIKLLSESQIIAYEQLLSKLMEKRQGRFVILKMNFGIYQEYSGTKSVLSLLAHQAQIGDARSQMALGYIYKNGLFNQPLDPDQAKACFKLATTSKDKVIAANAHFEVGHIHFIYTRDWQSAATHFDKASKQPVQLNQNNNEQASRMCDHSLKMLNNSHSLAPPNETERNIQQNYFRQKQELLTDLKEFFTSFNKTLSKGQSFPSFVKTHKQLQHSSAEVIDQTLQNTTHTTLELKR